MNILYKILNNTSEVIGVHIEGSDGYRYPISIKGLHSKTIFKELLSSGYKYYGAYVFEKEGKRINDLASIPFDSLSGEEQEEFDIVDDLLSDDELATHISTEPLKGSLQFKQPLEIVINTREELLDFLNKSSYIPEDSHLSYMPLNTFVNPKALFTVSEYVDPANNTYTSKIESRRNLTYNKFIRLKNKFKELGWVETDKAFDLTEFYFGWGLCGVNSSAVSIKYGESEYNLSTEIREGLPKVRIYKRILLKKDLTTIPPMPIGFKATEGDNNMIQMVNNLPDYQTVVPISIMADTTVPVKTVVLESANIWKLSTDYLAVESSTVYLRANTLTIHTLANTILPLTYWCTASDEAKKECFNYLQAELLTSMLLDKLTVKADISSYKALRRFGMLEPNAICRVLNSIAEGGNMDKLSKEDKEAFNAENSKIATIARNITPYFKEQSLSGSIVNSAGSSEDIDTDIVEEYVNSVKSGEYNIGFLNTGKRYDAMSDSDSALPYIFTAIQYLNISPAIISNLISELDVDNQGTICFKNDTFKLPMVVIKKSSAIDGYLHDIRNYRTKSCTNASYWSYITKIYAEPGTNGKQNRHVAVEMLQLFVYNKKLSKSGSIYAWTITDICNYVRELLESAIPITSDFDYVKNTEDSDYLNRLIAHVLFLSVINDGATIQVPKTKKGITLPKEIVNIIKNKFMVRRVISITDLADSIHMSGQEVIYIHNATVTSYYIVPVNGFDIEVNPIYPSWILFANESRDISALKSRKLISDNYECSLFTTYRSNFLPDQVQPFNIKTEKLENKAGSLYNYGSKYLTNEYMKSGTFKKPVHPFDAKYPLLSQHEQYDETFTGKYTHEPVHNLTFNEAYLFNGETLCLFTEPTARYELTNKFIHENATLTYDDLQVFTDINSLNEAIVKFPNGILIKKCTVSTLTFDDNVTISVSDINNYINKGYALVKLNGNTYLGRSHISIIKIKP